MRLKSAPACLSLNVVTMFSSNQKVIPYSALCLGLALGACAPTAQNVPVQDVPPTASAATGSARGVQDLNQLNALQAEVRELRNMLEEQQFEMENLRQRQQDLFQGLDQRLRVAETIQHSGNVIAPDGTVTAPGMLPPLDSAGATGDPSQPPGGSSADPMQPTAPAGSAAGQVSPPQTTQVTVAGGAPVSWVQPPVRAPVAASKSGGTSGSGLARPV